MSEALAPAPVRSWLRGASASILDQGLLSLLNFAIGFAFIRYATKEHYAVFAQLNAVLVLATSVQLALICLPAQSILPPLPRESRLIRERQLFVLQLGLSILIAVAVAAVLLLDPSLIANNPGGVVLPVAALIGLVGFWLREFRRYFLMIDMRNEQCLALDIVYAAASCAGLGALIAFQSMSPDRVILILGLAALIAVLPAWRLALRIEASDWRAWQSTLALLWPIARWSLPGVLLSWAFSTGYVLLAAKFISDAAIAEIVAARLFIAPLGMIFLGWANVFRPRIAHWFAQGRVAAIQRLSLQSLSLVAVGVAAYLLVFALVYPMIERFLLGPKYHGLFGDAIWWGAFFLVGGFAGIASGVLLALGRSRLLFFATLVGSGSGIALIAVLGSAFGKEGVLAGLVSAQAFETTILLIAAKQALDSARAADLPTRSPVP